MLNHTGLLKAARWVTRMYFELVAERLRFVVVDEVPALVPHVVIVSTTRSTTWRSDDSRSGVPSVPRKYFWATMLVAFTDHVDRELDVALLEGDRAVLPVGDAGVTTLPHELVVGVDARRREQPAEADGESFGCQ